MFASDTVIAYVLSFALWGQMHFIPGIADEMACRTLALQLSLDYKGVDAAQVRNGKCTPYRAPK